jgi:transposase
MADEKPKPTKRTFTREFKREAIALAEKGEKSIAQLERDLGLTDGLLRHWIRAHRAKGTQAFPGTGHQTEAEEEIRRLRRELDITRQERDILKKAVAIFADSASSATSSSPKNGRTTR